MKTITCALVVVLSVAGLAGCATRSQTSAAPAEKVAAAPPPPSAAAETNLLSSESARASYAIGMSLGRTFQSQGVEVDTAVLVRGIKDTLSGGALLLTPDEMRETLTELQKNLMVKAQKMREAMGVTNKAAGEAFLATNRNNPGVVTLADGLQYVVITNGTGAVPSSNDVVKVTYRGTLLDGTVFDDSKGSPRQFSLNSVIPGWTEALMQMNAGAKWKIFVPSNLAYGESGRPPRIMPNSVLIFEMELVDVEHPKPPEPLTSDIVKVPSLEEMKKGAKIEVIKAEDAAKVQATQTPSPATNQPAK
jgi:FKBP-type peptidyl-prolyl cis-trans isomerase FklB